jgi:hypothetical protein
VDDFAANADRIDRNGTCGLRRMDLAEKWVQALTNQFGVSLTGSVRMFVAGDGSMKPPRLTGHATATGPIARRCRSRQKSLAHPSTLRTPPILS